MAINLSSYNQILGAMVRKMVGDSVINDVNVGSVILTLLEAAAQVDFENNASILNVLDLLSIDAVADSDLDNRAADYGLTRFPAQKATGFVTIVDSTFTELSSGLYQVLLPPVAGSTIIYVNNAAGWANTGTLFIGRGTPQYEGPIAYTSITDNTSYYTIQLATALQNNHLISETVINAQGTTDRLVAANTVVQIPANSVSAAVQFVTLRNAIIPAGETTVTNVAIIASFPGSSSNASINTITGFVSPPFTGATVFNPVALVTGTDVETDAELRERIKAYANTLARGTEAAILAAIIGLSDPNSGTEVSSAVVVEPAVLGDPAIVYIDDGQAFQPTFVGQPIDPLLTDATGTEEFLQLANFPLPRPQVINLATAPYLLVDQMAFRVLTDITEETIIFSADQFANISAALVSEVIIAINSQSVNFKAAFTNDSNNILLFPTNYNTETIQVAALESTDNPLLFANTVLEFPTDQFSYITLFQNNIRLHEQERTAALITTPFTSWTIAGPGDLIIAIDNTPPQDRSFSVADFGGAAFNTLTLADWATAFNAKFAGLTATATSSNTLQLVSNKEGSKSELQILGGSYFNTMFGNLPTMSVGQDGGFQLNRQTGNLQILTTIEPGDTISAGVADAKGAIFSEVTTSGTYNVSTDAVGRVATMVIVADSASVIPRTSLLLAIGNTITIQNPAANIMRVIASTTSAFPAIQPGDFVYITGRTSGWVDPADTGLFKVVAKGAQTTAGVDTFVDVNNANTVTGGPFTVQDPKDIQAFSADTYPQLWQGTLTTTPALAPLQNVVDTLNDNTVNTISSIFKTDSVKITSSTENGGSIAIPVSIGNATNLFITAQNEEPGNPSMIGSQTNNQDIISYFKRTTPTNANADGVSGKVVWFDRVQYTDIRGALTSDAIPGIEGVNTYGEVLQSTGVLTPANLNYDDVYNATSGANKYQYRSIRDEIAGNAIGTQFELPTTVMDYVVNDTFNLMRPVGFSPQDSLIVVLDNNAIDNTIDIPMWRTGVINTDFAATTVSFSATDADNQPGITFSNLVFWGTTSPTNTNFMNYAVYMQARNWYVSTAIPSTYAAYSGTPTGGISGPIVITADNPGTAGNSIVIIPTGFDGLLSAITAWNTANPLNTASLTSGYGGQILPVQIISLSGGIDSIAGGAFIVRSNEYGPHGENIRFNVVYPSLPNLASTMGQINTPDYTAVTYYFGSGAAINTGVAAGNTFTVTALGNNIFRYAFVTGSINLSTVVAGDILSILPGSGVSTPNSGQFNIQAVNAVAKTIDVYNPDGASTAATGAPQVTIISVLPDVIGSQTSSTVAVTSGTTGATIATKWFMLNDSAGSVAVYYTLGAVPTPASLGVNRIIPVLVNSLDTASTITAETNGSIAADSQFRCTYFGLMLTIVNNSYGALAGVTDSISSPTGFVFSSTTGIAVDSLNGKFFYLVAPNEVVGFWYDTTGSTPQPLMIEANRAVRIGTVVSGDSADTVATKTAAIINADADFIATATGSGISVTNRVDGNTSVLFSLAGTTGFGFGTATDGASLPVETIAIPTLFIIFPLTGTAVASVVATINTSPLVNAAVIAGNTGNIIRSTSDEVYTPAGVVFTGNTVAGTSTILGVPNIAGITNGQTVIGLGIPTGTTVVGATGTTVTLSAFATATISSGTFVANPNYSESLAYGHNPYPNEGLNTYISLYDGINWVKDFENINPNFTLKTPMILQGVSPSTYSVINAPNPGSAVTGEYFKLVPTTLNNVYHQMTQKALSQLPIIAGVNISNNIRRIQIKSKQFGSQGAVQVLGGNANGSALSIVGVANVVPGLTENHIKVQTAAFPVTLTEGSIVSVTNQNTTQRFSTVGPNDTIDVSVGSNDTASYLYDSKVSTVNSGTTVSINDVSSTYGRAAGIVWRWTTTASFSNVNAGDMLNVFGTFSGWNSGNKSNQSGGSYISGFPIISGGGSSFDVVNPYGVAMPSSTPVGSGNIQVSPTPILQWNLAHAAESSVAQVVLAAPHGTATVTTNTQNHLREGDTFILSDNAIAQTATVVTVMSPTSFTFTDTTGDAAGTYILGNVIRSGRTPTRYRIEPVGFNSLWRLQYAQGDAPLFVDCGAAVDDTLVISGSTFSTGNNGRFQIVGIDNTSILFTNPSGVADLNTLVPLNNIGTTVQWTSGTNTVTGVAGAFVNVAIGDWIKQEDDSDTLFVQVTATLNSGLAPTTAALATVLLLGSPYQGVTDVGLGVSFDELNNVNKGAILQDMGDVVIINGDSAQVDDILYIDKLAVAGWFYTENSGTFNIAQVGTDLTTYRPYLGVINASAQAQTGVTLGIDLPGYTITEGTGAKYSSVRVVDNTAIDGVNPNLRDIYLTPTTRTYKMTQANGTQVIPLGKLQYPTSIDTGLDGYDYYTGLLQAVQYTIDGFEPDSVDYPGYRAIGGAIEVLAPLIHRVTIAVTITLNNGVNINEISNSVQAAILGYINNLGVGADVVLSEITVAIMNINGVNSVVFTDPSPTVASITIADNEHAYSTASDITITQ